MRRLSRAVVPGFAYHVTQRAAGRRPLFHENRDRYIYLSLLRQAAEAQGLHFEGFCLMDEHVHLIALSEHEESLALGLRWAHTAYARYYRTTHGGAGRVWQPGFRSCLLDGEYRWRALAYIEMNPVRTRCVEQPEDHIWSSARAHLDRERSYLRLDLSGWARHWDSVSWAAQLSAMRRDYVLWRDLERATRTGHALASEMTVKWLEGRLSPAVPADPPREELLVAMARAVGQESLPLGN
jgi:putative transposase